MKDLEEKLDTEITDYIFKDYQSGRGYQNVSALDAGIFRMDEFMVIAKKTFDTKALEDLTKKAPEEVIMRSLGRLILKTVLTAMFDNGDKIWLGWNRNYRLDTIKPFQDDLFDHAIMVSRIQRLEEEMRGAHVALRSLAAGIGNHRH